MSTVQSHAQRRWSRRQRRTAWFYAFIAPWLLGFIFLWIIPLGVGFLTSLTDYDGLNLVTLKFVGLRNYARAFTIDPDAPVAFVQTLRWGVLNMPAWIILSFILALILNQDVRGRGILRTVYYLPAVVPLVAIVWIWRTILDRNAGFLNAILSVFRPGTAVPWLTTQALVGLTVVAVWSGLGYGMIIFLAGLQGVPDELVEAARIDGASNLQVFQHVTIPLMTPVIFFMVVTGLIGAFQQYVLPQLLAGGGNRLGTVPPRSVYMILGHINRQVFVYQRFGYGMALLWMLCIVVGILTIVVFKTSHYWVYTDAKDK